MIAVVIGCMIGGGIVALIASFKGRSGGWFFLYGFLLFPIAFVHAAIMRSRAVAAQPARAILTPESRALEWIKLAAALFALACMVSLLWWMAFGHR